MTIKTNWYIITGTLSSGKTKVIESLAALGYAVVPEAPRMLIDAERSKGKTTQEIRANEAEFQKRVFQARTEVEDKIPPEQLTFFDGGGIPSCLAYYQICGLDSTPVVKESQKRKYQGVFFLARLPLEKDYARVEDEKTADDLARLIYEAYLNLGYKVIRVPVMSVKERVQFILNKINQ